MKHILMAAFLLFISAGYLNALPPLPSCYHNYDQIVTKLNQWENQYPEIAKVYNIGHSQQDNIPIYAMKLSINVAEQEPEPSVLFIGQVHAEEVLGVEVVMSNIQEILQNSTSVPYGSWLAHLQMWFIPTLTPEGHNVVTSGMDPSYRKNKRDNNNNGIFDYSPLVGYDIDGVDINRNFRFNWVHGDTLYHPIGLELYDYYRGPDPMSESESQALENLCDLIQPVFSIIWHSSRTGNLSEKVFYPVNYYGVRPAPDLLLSQQIGEAVAAQIIKENGTGGYEASAAEGRKGGANDFLYQKYGTIALVIECGTANLQPDSTLMVNTVQRCSNGTRWLLNRALPFSPNVPSSSMLRGTVRDAVTNLPLQAEIIVEQRHAPWFAPRLSNPDNGRYFRPVSNGTYTIRIRKKGYADFVVTNFTVNNGSWTTLNADLQPLTPVTVAGTIRSSATGLLIPAQITLLDLQNDVIESSGEFVLNTYQGSRLIEIYADGYYPYIGQLDIAADVNQLELNYVLSPAVTVFSEDWENGTANWVLEGPWVTQNELSVSGYAITDSWGGLGFYAQNCNVWIKTANPVLIPVSGNSMLVFDQHLYTEFVYDSVRVEISTNNNDWQMIYAKTGQWDWWHPVYLPLDQYQGQDIYLRFRLTDQSTHFDLTDPGWTLDNIRIVNGSATSTEDMHSGQTPFTALYPNYPNPFNPSTTIRFALVKDSRISLDVYNLKGQRVKRLFNGLYPKGTHSLIWDGTDENGSGVSSGVYFVRMNDGTKTRIQKMMLMK